MSEQTYESALSILEEKILNDPQLAEVSSFLHALMQESHVEGERYTNYHQTKCPLEMAWSAFTGKVDGRPEISNFSKYILKLMRKSWVEAVDCEQGRFPKEKYDNRVTPIPDDIIKGFDDDGCGAKL